MTRNPLERPKALEPDNRRLTRVAAYLSLDKLIRAKATQATKGPR